LYYLYLKALHIIFVVCWFAGLFYTVRLFVYYAEAQSKSKIEQTILREQYKVMLYRLWYIIAFPSAVIATVAGVLMLIDNSSLLKMPWMHLKLVFVALLWGYHLICHRFFKQIQKQSLKKSGNFFRLWNEGATLILFSVVFIVVLIITFNWLYGLLGLVLLAVLLMLGIRIYKRVRAR